MMKEKQTPESKIRDEANIAETLEDVLEECSGEEEEGLWAGMHVPFHAPSTNTCK